MKVSEAIEILNYWETDVDAWNDADTDAAIKLGMEALKRIESCRVGDAANVELPLPGETTE